jgi:hypothetical protein
MLKFIGSVVLLLTAVLPIISNVVIDEKHISHCPDGSNEIDNDESITGLSCINLNCSNDFQLCWGSTICNSGYGTFCESLESSPCYIVGTMSSTFKVCRSIPSETSAINNLSEIIEGLSTEVIPLMADSSRVKRFLSSSTLMEDKVNILSKFCELD